MSPSSILDCDNLSQLIQRHNLIVHNVDERNLLEDLPVSLTYEIAGWSRISRRQKLDRCFAQSDMPSQNCALFQT
ncbi:UNVERIFIED_CONTAM: hypothetical protein FO487_03425 [Bacillus amyloliquefaciens DSM 7 = ATCC 23350]|nr:hypothetical protein FVD41_01825 [Bacillus amyloliquefaciens]